LPTLLRAIFFNILLGTIGFSLLIGGYSVLRRLRISVDRVTRIVGTVLMAASVVLCLSILRPDFDGRTSGYGNLLGRLSFIVAIYSASQWTTRQWYMRVKRRTTSWLVRGSKNVLLFLYKQHTFFGWVVTLTAIGHMVPYLPVLKEVRQYDAITGFIALGILVFMVLLGMWMWFQVTVKKQPMPQRVHTIHAVLAIAFFVTLLLHMVSPAL
jgi:hypothetical protein